MSEPHPDPRPPRPKNPLHGVTLERIVTRLAEHHGWEELGILIPINCFRFDPSVKSSLVFLRKTPWARKKVEQLYLSTRFKEAGEGQPESESPVGFV